jgi:hypothetical protein
MVGSGTTPIDRSLVSTAVGGIAVEAKLIPAKRGFVVDATFTNRRDRRLLLEPDACGQAGMAELKRADGVQNGREWSGSVQSLKTFVLEQQLEEDRKPEPIPPGGRCEPATVPIALEPGERVKRRWKVERSTLLDGVGALHASVEIDVREAGRRIASGSTRGSLAPAVEWPVRRHSTSLAEQFDRLLDDPRLYRILAAEPAESWMGGALVVEGDVVILEALSRRYSEPILAFGHVDRTAVEIRLPPRRAAPLRPDGQLS